jgi:hypothetical protein
MFEERRIKDMNGNEILTILRNKYIFATLKGYKDFKSSDSSYNSKIINSKKMAFYTFFNRKNKIKQDRKLKDYKIKLEKIIKDNNLKNEFNQHKTTMENIDLKDIANQIQQAFSSIEVDEENSNNSEQTASYAKVKAEFEKILKIRERIYNINNIKDNEKKVNKLNEYTKALNTCFNEILSLLKLKAISGKSYMLFKEDYQKIDKKVKSGIYKKLSILRTIVLGQAVTEFIGESGEITALFAAIGQTKANNVLNNALQQIAKDGNNFAIDGEVVGKNTSTVKKILTPFGDSIELKVSSLISEVGTQDKTDVTLKFINEGKPMNLSVKSSAQSKTAPVHLQSVNLYENLYNVDRKGEFLTHYSNFLLYDDSDDLGNIKFQDLLKRHLAFEAISSGNLFKEGVSWADTFVYINWETGKVYVNYINDILNETDNFSYSSEINEIKNVLKDSNKIDKSDSTFPYFNRHKKIYEGLLKHTIDVELKTSKLKKYLTK